MGLLDSLAEAFSGNTESSRRTLGLLAAAGPTTDPNQAGFGARMVRANGYVDDWKKQQMEMERAKQIQEFQAFQMEQAKAQMAQQARAAQQQEIDTGAVRGAFAPMDGGRAMANGMGPTIENAQNIGQVAQFDPRQFLAQNPQASMGALKQAMDLNKSFNPEPEYSFTNVEGNLVRTDKKGNASSVFEAKQKPAATPAAFQEYLLSQQDPNFGKFLNARDAAKGVKVTVPVNMQGDSEYAKAQGKDYSETMSNLNKQAFAAPSQLRKLERMVQLLDGVDGGKLAPLGTDIASYANSFGIKIDPKLGNKEASVSLAREMAGALRQPGTGPMTDKDFENFMAQIPDLSKSAEGRKQIMTTMRAGLARDVELAKRARAYEKANGRIDGGFMDEASQFIAENPVVALPQGYRVVR